MAIGEGYVTVLGTVVVAALAIGVAVGTHAMVGDTTVVASASPGVTTSVSLSGDFCTIMGDLNTYYASRSAESGVLNGTIDLTAGEDPAVLDAIHAQADPLQEITAAMAVYLGHGAEVVGDATVAEALRTMSAYIKAQGEGLAQASRDSASVNDFMIAAFAATIASQQTAADVDAATVAITDYVKTECAIDVSAALWMDGSGDSSDGSGDPSNGSTASADSAKADASMLGTEITLAFLNWQQGDPPLEVSLSGGMYGVTLSSVIDGGTSSSTSFVTAASSDPAIVDQSITGPLDWCVSVTDNAAASPTTYRYSATGGLEEGTCAALAAAA